MSSTAYYVRANLAALLGAAMVISNACERRGPEGFAIPSNAVRGESPVRAVADYPEYHRIVFYPEPGAGWKKLLDMRLFDGFWPGMTSSEAEGTLGLPADRGEDQLGPFWEYERPLGRIRIAHELKGSLPFVRWWRLRGFPYASAIQDLLHPSVAQHVPANPDGLELVIMDDQGSPVAFLRLENRHVAWIDWVSQ